MTDQPTENPADDYVGDPAEDDGELDDDSADIFNPSDD